MWIVSVFLVYHAIFLVETYPPGEKSQQENRGLYNLTHAYQCLPLLSPEQDHFIEYLQGITHMYNKTDDFSQKIHSQESGLLKRPVHLEGIQLERDGELNREFRQEVLLGGGSPKDSKDLRAMVKKMFYETDENKDGSLSLEELEKRIANNTLAHIEEGIREARSHFAIVDKNGDGQVSWHEYIPHLFSKDSSTDGYEHKPMNDKNAVAREQLSFDKADLDGDGFLDSEEWLRFFHPEHNVDSLKEMASEIVKMYDKNGDGMVSKEEFAVVQPSEKQENGSGKTDQKRKVEREDEFDRHIDLNRDGMATLKEIFEYINPQNARSLAVEATELLDTLDTNRDRVLSLDELLAQDRLVEFSPLFTVSEILHEDL